MKKKTGKKQESWSEFIEMLMGIYIYLLCVVCGFVGFIGSVLMLLAGKLMGNNLFIICGTGAMISSVLTVMLYSYGYYKIFEKEDNNGNKSK